MAARDYGGEPESEQDGGGLADEGAERFGWRQWLGWQAGAKPFKARGGEAARAGRGHLSSCDLKPPDEGGLPTVRCSEHMIAPGSVAIAFFV